MRLLLRVAIAAASIGSIPPAMADQSGPSRTQPTEVIAEAPAQAIPPRDAVLTNIRSDHGPWLFPPIGKYLDQQARG